MAAKPLHVMMFPWLAFGHMLPYLELSKLLAQKGIKISFISTPRNLQRLPQIPQNLADKIRLVELPLPSVEGLPEDCEATMDLQRDQVEYLKKAYDMLLVPFEELLQRDLPDLLLVDFTAYWIPKIAAKLGVKTGFFSVFTAATLAYFGPPNVLISGDQDSGNPQEWFTFPSLVTRLSDYEHNRLRKAYSPDASGVSTGQRFGMTVIGCDFIALRSCKEFEREYIDLVQELYQKPVVSIGLLPPVLTDDQILDDTSNNSSNRPSIFKWLDQQREKSVVFVGFGSEYKMPIHQVHELAFGLELSNLPFLWILRKPDDDVDHALALLPSGFEARTSNRSILCLEWAPQAQILAHSSIGGCLFHSGWGTIIESLSFGHALILLPMVADQGLNGRLLVEKGVGYEVPRNEDNSFDRYRIAEALKLVMRMQEGKGVRLKGGEMQNVFGNKDLHEEYISKFIEYIGKFKRSEQVTKGRVHYY